MQVCAAKYMLVSTICALTLSDRRDRLEGMAPDVQAARQTALLCRYPHPFGRTLDRLPSCYNAWQLEAAEPEPPVSIDSQPLEFVRDQKLLQEVAEHLDTVKEFAVDLEHSDRYVALILLYGFFLYCEQFEVLFPTLSCILAVCFRKTDPGKKQRQQRAVWLSPVKLR
jgi:hypothetical protein